MIGNYLLVFFRNFTRRKLYSFINALGLSIAIGFCLLVYLFISDELSFDRFHTNRERIYKIVSRNFVNMAYERGDPDPYSYSSLPNSLVEALLEGAPEVEYVTQIRPGGKQIIKSAEKTFSQQIVFTDSSFFKIFSFEKLAGSGHRLFHDPTDAVITPEVARRFFGDKDPIGKTVYIDSDQLTAPAFTVKAVVSCPPNSSIAFEVLIPLASNRQYLVPSWFSGNYQTFVLLNPDIDLHHFKTSLDNIVNTNLGDWIKSQREHHNLPSGLVVQEYIYERLVDTHFNKKIGGQKASDPLYSWILAAIAAMIILIASINYVSFALTASASRRKEIGIRKTIGASGSQIFQQFNIESLSLAGIAACVGVVLAVLLMPMFNSLTQKEISILSIDILYAGGFLATLTLVVGMIAGSYPALFVSRIKPVLALKASNTRLHLGFARPLVVLQFAMSAFLMISSLIMYRQMRFIATKNLGYTGDNVISVLTQQGWSETSDRVVEQFRNESRTNPDILDVAGVSGSFPWGSSSMGINYKEIERQVYVCRVDHEYIPLLDLQLLQGQNFAPGNVGDSTSIIVNEALVRNFGWTDPLNERLHLNLKENDPGMKVIGVVKDFHFLSLEQEIKPLFLEGSAYRKSYLTTLLVKLNGADLPGSLASAERHWKKLYPDKPFDYTFLDDGIARNYNSYKRWMKIAGAATTMAILIASLGLFGLAGINAVRRTKEIGIRKVLGADFKSIFIQLNAPFVILAIIAFLLASPASWYVMNQWMNRFAYHISIGWEVFALSIFSGLVIALSSVSYHAVKVTRINPAETLKTE